MMNDIFELISIAREGIDNGKLIDIHSFEAELARREFEVNKTLIENVWKQCWHEHCQRIRNNFKLRIGAVFGYYYEDHVGKGKELSEEDFDEILKSYGLMRIKSEEAS